MKGWIVLGVLTLGLAGLGLWYATSYRPVSTAKDAYEQWAEQRLRNRFEGQFDVRGGGTENVIGGEGGRRTYVESQHGRSTLHGSVFRYDDAVLDGDRVEIRARHVIQYDPPGVISAYGSETDVVYHRVVLLRNGDVWTVEDFEETADG